MSNNKISYLSRTFDDYKQSLREYIGQYYPQIATDLNDASVGSWMLDMVAAVADNLSYYIDKAYNETNLDTANQRSSVMAIARSNGLRVPGPKGSMALCEFSCEVPIHGQNRTPKMEYAPIIKKGTKVGSRDQVFEVMNDIDFSEQYDYNMFPNREIIPIIDSNNEPVRYLLRKKEVVVAGESKIYKQIIANPSDINPFMEIVIPDTDVMNVESIIFKDGTNHQQDPYISDFMTDCEESMIRDEKVYRFFEVDNLTDAVRWGDVVNSGTAQEYCESEATKYKDESGNEMFSVVKGAWLPVTQKFITEFTDNGYLKVIFGSGEQIGAECQYDGNDFAKYQISRMVKNNFLGKLPPVGSTMYILYRRGGGTASNVPANSINQILYLNACIGRGDGLNQTALGTVKRSISVNNPIPSVTGKDAPTVDEIKAMIKYNNSAQNRCITVKDYENRIMLMPPRYGCPFRVSVTEENNKVMVYMLGLNSSGKLSAALPQQTLNNISEYLSKYRAINDFVEMKVGRIVNIGVDADIFIDKNYSATEVVSEVMGVIKDFFDINKHRLGETIYLSMLMKNISDVSGVMNLMDLRIYNKICDGYSSDRSIDPVFERNNDCNNIWNEFAGDPCAPLIDTITTKYTLNCDVDAMFEIKYPDVDIKVRSITR